jgi:hypothetical protein
MENESLMILVIKTLVLLLLFLYFLVGILIARQVWLMNRAIKTRLAGCLTCIAIVHVFLILFVLVFVVLA